jgi:N4-(beta-N-acetylglucosaminyl)-L-asparaginase
MSQRPIPCLAATWGFGSIAINAAVPSLIGGRVATDVVEQGIRAVELDNQDQYCVSVGGYPNSRGVMELDAAIMDEKRRYGAVMALQDIANPISVAKTVMEKSPHNVLVGEGAKFWAMENGFISENILTVEMKKEWEAWLKSKDIVEEKEDSHDTVGFICLDQHGNLAAGTSTSGYEY